MQFLKWILALPLIIGAIFFAIGNSDLVSVVFNPFGLAVNVPLYIICFLFLSGGFLLGTIATWFSSSNIRKERRKQKKEIKKLEKELIDHNEKMAETLNKISPGSKYQNIIDHEDL